MSGMPVTPAPVGQRGPDRIVTFTEVKFGPGNWFISTSLPGFLTYSFSPEAGRPSSVGSLSSLTITRSDGKVLTIEITDRFECAIGGNVIMFYSKPGQSSDRPFQ